MATQKSLADAIHANPTREISINQTHGSVYYDDEVDTLVRAIDRRVDELNENTNQHILSPLEDPDPNNLFRKVWNAIEQAAYEQRYKK